jgi:hypothetical protein
MRGEEAATCCYEGLLLWWTWSWCAGLVCLCVFSVWAIESNMWSAAGLGTKRRSTKLTDLMSSQIALVARSRLPGAVATHTHTHCDPKAVAKPARRVDAFATTQGEKPGRSLYRRRPYTDALNRILEHAPVNRNFRAHSHGLLHGTAGLLQLGVTPAW